MEEELQLDLEEGQKINKIQERINSLATKVAEEARAKEEAQGKLTEAEARTSAAEKKLEFVTAFSDVAGKYQGANDFRKEIEEKVDKGYTIEDATVSVLNANGKLVPQAEEIVPPAPAGGGSAPTALPNSAASTGEMTRDELRSELMKPERQTELERVLRQGF